MALKTDVGAVTAHVRWDLDENEPDLRFDIEVADSGFGTDLALAMLAAAARRAATEIDKARANGGKIEADEAPE
jgi:hypothetical protein